MERRHAERGVLSIGNQSLRYKEKNMRPIPLKIRKQINNDPWYKFCCRCGDYRKIEIHHTIIWQGRQLNELWSLVPACNDCHRKVGQDRNVKEYFEWIALRRATDKEIQAISKVINYFRLLENYNKKFYGNTH